MSNFKLIFKTVIAVIICNLIFVSSYSQDNSHMDPSENILDYNFNEIPPSGCYASFSHLTKGEEIPGFKGKILRITERKNLERFKLLAAQGKELKKRALFLSDGEHVYIRASVYLRLTGLKGTTHHSNKYFVKSRQHGRFIFFVDEVTDVMAGVGFGLTGSLLAANNLGVILDTSTGEVSILKNSAIREIGKSHPALVEEYFNSKMNFMDKSHFVKQLNETWE